MKNSIKTTLIGMVILAVVMVTLSGCGSAQEATTVTFTDLKDQENGVDVVSEYARDLDGELIEIKGWMSPLSPFKANYFYLINVPSNECPFCAGGEVNYTDLVIVMLKEGEMFDFSWDPITVRGTLAIEQETTNELNLEEHTAGDLMEDYFYLFVEDTVLDISTDN